jgi:hypothetical protein
LNEETKEKGKIKKVKVKVNECIVVVDGYTLSNTKTEWSKYRKSLFRIGQFFRNESFEGMETNGSIRDERRSIVLLPDRG